MMKTYYRKAKGSLLVYDVTSRASFHGLEVIFVTTQGFQMFFYVCVFRCERALPLCEDGLGFLTPENSLEQWSSGIRGRMMRLCM